MKLNSNYTGLVAQLYDLFLGEEPLEEEEAFYRNLIEQVSGSALEIACGTGRMLIPYLRTGQDVEGVDCSAEMLEICRQKAQSEGFTPILYQQYMQTLALQKKYKTIYIPSGSFQLVSNRDEAFEALRRFYAHINLDGQLIISTFVPWDELADTKPKSWSIRRTATRSSDNATILCLESATLNRVEQIKTGWYRYEVYKQGKLVETQLQVMQLRWYFKYEFRLMLENVGFRNILTYGDCTDAEASDQHSAITFVARK